MSIQPIVRRYEPADADALFHLLEREGEDWKDYWQGEGWRKYQRAMTGSIVYLLLEGEELCGYARCRDDGGYGVYVYDLLVDKARRGKEYGRMLLEQVYRDFSDDTVYVMSDVDAYYAKLGYEVEGTIFVVQPGA